MVHTRIPNELPILVVLHPRQSNICCSWHVWDIDPQSDVQQCCTLHLVQCGCVAEPEWEMHDMLVGSPRVDGYKPPLICAHEHRRTIHANHNATHSIDVPNGFVQVFGEHDAHACEYSCFQWCIVDHF